jgi:NADPH:quinone reductase
MPKATSETAVRTREHAAQVPQTMRAAAIDRFGSPDAIKLHTLPTPQPDHDEVLIAIHTAGVGPWDAEIREGWIEGAARFPLVLGTDGSGTVVMAGSRVRRLREGDKVYSYSWANPKGGFYAEYVAVSQAKAARIPVNLNMEEAGAVATIGLTALQGIDDALSLRSGEVIAIHGAAGGVGSVAVQFAKWRGARVIATATTEAGLQLVRRLGADHAVLGHLANIVEAAASLAPDGLDAVLALAGGATLERIIDLVKRAGRVAYPNGINPPPRKRAGLRVAAYDAVSNIEEFAKLNLAIEAAKLVVPIAGAYPLQQAGDAHKRLQRGHVLGKVVLRVASGK